jgi:hypothetical protein
MFESLVASRSRNETVARICEAFDAGPEDVASDLDGMVEGLEKMGIIELTEVEASAKKKRKPVDTISFDIVVHFLTLKIHTHSNFVAGCIRSFFKSNEADERLSGKKCSFDIWIEEADSPFSLSFNSPEKHMPAWFSIGDYPLMFGRDGRFYGKSEDGNCEISIDAARRMVHANIAGSFANSEETFLYTFFRDLLRKFVGPLSGLFTLHGAVMAKDDKVIMLAGDSGAGKSTLSLQFVQAGYRVISDDSPLVTVMDSRAYVLSSLDELSVTPATAAMFPWLEPCIRGERDQSKKLYISRDLFSCARLHLTPAVLTHYIELQRGQHKMLQLKPLSRTEVTARIIKEYMPIFSRLKCDSSPTLFSSLDSQNFECLSLVTAYAKSFILEFDNHHLAQIPDLFC